MCMLNTLMHQSTVQEIDLLNPQLDPRVIFTRASTKTYFGADGLMHTAASDVWPLEYDPITHQPLGRSVWEQRTNLLLNSATLSTQSVTVSATATTLTFWGTGTVTLSGAATGSLVGTGAANRVSLTFTPSAGALTLTVSGTVSKAQLEAGTFASPYIPTVGSQVTRAAETATVNLNTIRYNPAQETVRASLTVWSQDPTRQRYIASLGLAGRFFYFPGNNSTPRAYDGTTVVNGSTAFPLGTKAAAASSFGPAGLKIASPGSSVNTAAYDGDFEPTATQMILGWRAGSTYLNDATLRTIRLYPCQVSDSEHQVLAI